MRNRLVILVLVLIMVCSACLSAGAEDTADTNTYIKVGLRYDSPEISAEITSVGGLTLCSVEDGTITRADHSLDNYGDIFLVLKDGAVAVEDHSGAQIAVLRGDGTECIVSGHYFADNDYICLDGTAYRGGIIPYINDSAQLNIINYVELEDYVKGVLNREMKHRSSMEALKAQAVTARSFAVVNKDKHGAQGFDVCTGTHCQCYAGASGEYASIVHAAASTEGQILYYNDEPVEGLYCANSGGYTENSEDVWSSEQGYLRSVKDNYSPDSSWTVSFTRRELTEKLADQDIGTVYAVGIDSVTETGSIASMTYFGERGKFTVTNDEIRALLDLRSRRFIIRKDDTANDMADHASGLKALGAALSIPDDIGPLPGQITENADSDDICIIWLDSDEETVIFDGKGFGHGAGMSQQGAQNMARLGFDYIDILNYYYTDIEVR